MSRSERHSYTPYGFAETAHSAKPLLGFNGEYLEAQMSLYMLGSGYRAFSPSLHRFHSADNLSPFSTGGLNAYAYCSGDPVNRIDPTGHSGLFVRLLKGLGNMFGLRSRRNIPTTTVNRAASVASESLTYASVNSRSSGSSTSSGYAGVNSYTTVSSANAPSLPQRRPPSSGGSSSRFTTDNPERIPTGQGPSEISKWLAESSIEIKQQPSTLLYTIPEKSTPDKRFLAVIKKGIRRGEDYLEATKSRRIPTMYADGSIFTWKDRRR
ncbi:RHS repeat-associated core domain-containing protein [Pseudomonas inefficax]|uniref:RHS repeat-associated core domain-containing protein n=1 Tax=Pseudomonas inefficax TaxID=2078786 RepID=UPI004046FAFB